MTKMTELQVKMERNMKMAALLNKIPLYEGKILMFHLNFK